MTSTEPKQEIIISTTAETPATTSGEQNPADNPKFVFLLETEYMKERAEDRHYRAQQDHKVSSMSQKLFNMIQQQHNNKKSAQSSSGTLPSDHSGVPSSETPRAGSGQEPPRSEKP